MFDKGVDAIIDHVSADINSALAALEAPVYYTERQLNSEVPYFKEWRERKVEVLQQHSLVMAKELVTHAVLNGMMEELVRSGQTDPKMGSVIEASLGDVESKYRKDIKELADEAYEILLSITKIKGT